MWSCFSDHDVLLQDVVVFQRSRCDIGACGRVSAITMYYCRMWSCFSDHDVILEHVVVFQVPSNTVTKVDGGKTKEITTPTRSRVHNR